MWAARQVQTAEEGEGDSSPSSHRSFLPTVFFALSLWAPESEASRAVTSPSLYTNSCIFLLLFTAKGGRERVPAVLKLPEVSGAGSSYFAVKAAQAVDGEHPGGAPSSGA